MPTAHKMRSAFAVSASTMVGAAIAGAVMVAATSFVGPAGGAESRTQAPGAASEMPSLIYSRWQKFCGMGEEPGAKQTCVTSKEGRLDSGMPVVGAALIEPEGGRMKVLRVTMPNGVSRRDVVSLRHGARVSIDRNDPLAAPFVACVENACMADFEATGELVAKLKTGHTLLVQAVSLAGSVFGFALPLVDANGNSFVKTNEGPAIDPKVFREQCNLLTFNWCRFSD